MWVLLLCTPNNTCESALLGYQNSGKEAGHMDYFETILKGIHDGRSQYLHNFMQKFHAYCIEISLHVAYHPSSALSSPCSQRKKKRLDE